MRAALPFVLVAILVAACSRVPSQPASEAGTASAVAALTASDDTTGYARADAPREFVFPRDHGPHPDFQTEWWYLVGHLDAADPTDGRRFGFQWTVFRRALAPENAAPRDPAAEERRSRWATRQFYMGHFALTDVAADRHLAFERFARGAAGLAGAEAEPFAVWLEGWRLASVGDDGFWPLEVVGTAHQDDGEEVSVRLELAADKPLVLQGEDGLSRKNALPGGASYYYSFPRLRARGKVTVGGREVAVTGSAWLDREWSTSVLAPGQTGWDWFALQLDDGREVMVYQLRRGTGGAGESVDPYSSGVVVARDGSARRLGAGDFQLTVRDRWQSPHGARYPSRWRLVVPSAGLDLDVEPLVADQELDVSFRYWEGAVAVRGTGSGGTEITGRGYVELVGYE